MSILHTLKKLVDPLRARMEEAERRKRRETPRRESAGDPPAYACRVCGERSQERAYCPRCLADTMEPVPPR